MFHRLLKTSPTCANLKRFNANVAFHSTSPGKNGAIDVHTHMYLPGYMKILRKRKDVPYVREIDGMDRLVILPGEDKEKSTAIGRPIGREYFDVNSKLKFMDRHCIETSVVSLANPWLDFLSGQEAADVAQELNDELQRICEESKGRILGLATLPVRDPAAAVKEVMRLKSLSHIKGVILGTPGAGSGLDHANVRDTLAAIEQEGHLIFLHPHYGVGNEHFHDTGHALFLALGFPFETTVAVSRLILSGTLDQLPKLKLLVAHAGAALPSLIGRLDSCVAHDIAVSTRLKEEPSFYMKKMYFDAITYSEPAMSSLIGHVGVDRIMFGTDNPFFPPPSTKPAQLGHESTDTVGKVFEDDVSALEWPSTVKVYKTMGFLSDEVRDKIIHRNARALLHI